MPTRPEHVDFVSAVEQAPTADALGGRLSELNEELLVLLEQGRPWRRAEAAEKNAKAGARATKGALEKAKQAAATLRRRVAA